MEVNLKTLQNRYRGAFIGFLVADSLGSTTEFMTPEDVRKMYGVHQEIIGGGAFRWPAGSVTDDSDMALCVARSIVETGGYNLSDIAGRFVEWLNSNPPDVGSATWYGLKRYIETGELQSPYSHDQAGNGGLMRELPLILYFADSRDSMLQAVVEQAQLTHNHPESDSGCCCYADLVAAALQGADKPALLQLAMQYPLFSPEKYNGKAGGYIVETLRTVLHFFFTASSLESAVIGAVNMGQDADTNGALLGGLAGAFYGYEAVPQRWIKALNQDVLQEALQLADALLEMKY